MIEIKVRITAFSYKALKDLSREFNLDIVYRTAKEINENKYSVESFIFRKQMEKLKEAGYQIEILKDLTAIPDPRAQVSKINRYHNELDRLKKK